MTFNLLILASLLMPPTALADCAELQDEFGNQIEMIQDRAGLADHEILIRPGTRLAEILPEATDKLRVYQVEAGKRAGTIAKAQQGKAMGNDRQLLYNKPGFWARRRGEKEGFGTHPSRNNIKKLADMNWDMSAMEHLYAITVRGDLVFGEVSKDGVIWQHPNLIGGENPIVIAAGIIKFESRLVETTRFGTEIYSNKILSVDFQSGHFRPTISPESLVIVETILRKTVPSHLLADGFRVEP